jgi:hypothetical protein
VRRAGEMCAITIRPANSKGRRTKIRVAFVEWCASHRLGCCDWAHHLEK